MPRRGRPQRIPRRLSAEFARRGNPYPGHDPIERICNLLAPDMWVDARVMNIKRAGPGRPRLGHPCFNGRFYSLFVKPDGTGVLTDLTALEDVWTFPGPEPALYPMLPWVQMLRTGTGASVSKLTRLLCDCGIQISVNSVWRFCQRMDAAEAARTELSPIEVEEWRVRLRAAPKARRRRRGRNWLKSHQKWRKSHRPESITE